MTGWHTVTTRFEEVKQQAAKNLPCPDCGKKVRRSTTFSQTLNPFNKRADGTVKSRRDIWDDLAAQAKAWQSEPVQCTRCRDGAS